MNGKRPHLITLLLISFVVPFLPGRAASQDFTQAPQVFDLLADGWLNLFTNPAYMAYGAGTYSGFISGGFPSMSVRTNTGIMGYDGGYELSYRHNSQNSHTLGALTGFDISTSFGKLGFGLYPVGYRNFNLNLYTTPIGYYDTIPSETLPHFDWTFKGGGYGISAGFAKEIGRFSFGLAVDYARPSFKMSHIAIVPYTQVNDSIDVPIQFAYLPDYREFAADGKSFGFSAGAAIKLGRFRIGLHGARYGQVKFYGYASSMIYFPLDTLLSSEIDSAFFSGIVTKILGVSFLMSLPGYSEYAFDVTLPAGENGRFTLGVKRRIWSRPTDITMVPAFRFGDTRIDLLLDTFNFRFNDTWTGSIDFEYKTMNRSEIGIGFAYRTAIIDSPPYVPLFMDAGSQIKVKFGFRYLATDDISVEVRYTFFKNSNFINRSRSLSDDNLGGEYISSNDRLTIGFTYVFPEN